MNYNSPYIVITGAAGFIGSGCVRYLNDAGKNRLILVDDLGKTDKWKNLLGKRFEALLSPSELFNWLQGREQEVGAFLHLGACSDTLETDGDYLMENNLRYSIRLAEYALRHGQIFLYASSAATYGDGLLGFSDDHDRLPLLRPLNLYGFSKHSFDLWLQQQNVLDQVTGLKYFNVFGPNENHKGRMASMVYKMVPLVQSEGKISLFASNDPGKFADGEQCRDFIYVKDAVRMTCAFLDKPGGGIFNMGSGEPTTWNRLARAIFAALQRPVSIEHIPMPEGLSAQYQNYTCAAMAKSWKWLGMQCEYSIEAAVEDYVGYLCRGERW